MVVGCPGGVGRGCCCCGDGGDVVMQTGAVGIGVLVLRRRRGNHTRLLSCRCRNWKETRSENSAFPIAPSYKKLSPVRTAVRRMMSPGSNHAGVSQPHTLHPSHLLPQAPPNSRSSQEQTTNRSIPDLPQVLSVVLNLVPSALLGGADQTAPHARVSGDPLICWGAQLPALGHFVGFRGCSSSR